MRMGDANNMHSLKLGEGGLKRRKSGNFRLSDQSAGGGGGL